MAAAESLVSGASSEAAAELQPVAEALRAVVFVVAGESAVEQPAWVPVPLLAKESFVRALIKEEVLLFFVLLAVPGRMRGK